MAHKDERVRREGWQAPTNGISMDGFFLTCRIKNKSITASWECLLLLIASIARVIVILLLIMSISRANTCQTVLFLLLFKAKTSTNRHKTVSLTLVKLWKASNCSNTTVQRVISSLAITDSIISFFCDWMVMGTVLHFLNVASYQVRSFQSNYKIGLNHWTNSMISRDDSVHGQMERCSMFDLVLWKVASGRMVSCPFKSW